MVRLLDKRSVERLQGVNPALVQLVHEAFNLSEVPFIVLEGVRSKERQSYLFASGNSKTLLSKHLSGEAVDIAAIVDGKVNWSFEHYERIAQAFFDVASRLGAPIVWGGAWPKFRDGCHLDRKSTRLNSSHSAKSRMPSSA